MRHAVLPLAAVLLLAVPDTAGSQADKRPKSEAIEKAQYFLETGRVLEGGKVVGGQRADPGDDPWQVAFILPLSTTGGVVRLFCGGSFIGSGWVLTAAHCVDGSTDTTDFAVLVGSVDLYAQRAPVRADRILIHPDWQPAPRRWNDVALVHLAGPAPEAASIRLVPPSIDAESVSAKLTARVTGWGAVGETGGATQFLRVVNVSTVSRADCGDWVSHPGRITEGMFCAGLGAGGRDSCQGDSGGPLSVATASGRRLVGIVSWGEGCGKPAKYGVYTRVAGYAEWVRACVAGEPSCDWLGRPRRAR